MIVTEAFLDENRTERGAWTRAQVVALGLRWPLDRNWKREVIGKEITNAQADAFIRGWGVFSSRTRKKNEKRERRVGRIEELQREMAQLRKEVRELHERLAEVENALSKTRSKNGRTRTKSSLSAWLSSRPA